MRSSSSWMEAKRMVATATNTALSLASSSIQIEPLYPFPSVALHPWGSPLKRGKQEPIPYSFSNCLARAADPPRLNRLLPPPPSPGLYSMERNPTPTPHPRTQFRPGWQVAFLAPACTVYVYNRTVYCPPLLPARPSLGGRKLARLLPAG